jgi:hypothetical protein
MDQTTILTSDRFPDEPLTNEQALAQAAERWREFVAEARAVVEAPGWMADPVLVETKDCSYVAEAQAVVERWPEPGPECRLELAALAMSVVGPLPEKPAYKPSPKIQQQSDMALAASLLEGDRRKAQGLPPGRDAQARAAADAMAWAEENPPEPVAEAFAGLRDVAGGCLEGKHFDESREWAEDSPMSP